MFFSAENGIVCIAAEILLDAIDSDGNQNMCRVTFILNANLKGWIPQKLIDSSVAGTLEKTITHLRSYVQHLSDATG